jgi:heterodisulfide reductase subunit A
MSYETRGLAGESKTEEFDLMVLCPALIPSKDNLPLSEMLDVELDGDGFFRAPDISHPVDSTNKGILVCGFASGPIDIPDSVSQASAVAARAAELIEGGGGAS